MVLSVTKFLDAVTDTLKGGRGCCCKQEGKDVEEEVDSPTHITRRFDKARSEADSMVAGLLRVVNASTRKTSKVPTDKAGEGPLTVKIFAGTMPSSINEAVERYNSNDGVVAFAVSDGLRVTGEVVRDHYVESGGGSTWFFASDKRAIAMGLVGHHGSQCDLIIANHYLQDNQPFAVSALKILF